MFHQKSTYLRKTIVKNTEISEKNMVIPFIIAIFIIVNDCLLLIKRI